MVDVGVPRERRVQGQEPGLSLVVRAVLAQGVVLGAGNRPRASPGVGPAIEAAPWHEDIADGGAVVEGLDGEEPRHLLAVLVHVLEQEAVRPDGQPGVNSLRTQGPIFGVEFFEGLLYSLEPVFRDMWHSRAQIEDATPTDRGRLVVVPRGRGWGWTRGRHLHRAHGPHHEGHLHLVHGVHVMHGGRRGSHHGGRGRWSTPVAHPASRPSTWTWSSFRTVSHFDSVGLSLVVVVCITLKHESSLRSLLSVIVFGQGRFFQPMLCLDRHDNRSCRPHFSSSPEKLEELHHFLSPIQRVHFTFTTTQSGAQEAEDCSNEFAIANR